MTLTMIKAELRTLPLKETRSVNDNGLLKVEGYIDATNHLSEILSNSNNPEGFREMLAPGVFSDAIARNPKIDFLNSHDTTQVLSTTENGSLSLQENDNGLFISAVICPTTWGKDTYQMIIDGIIKGMSFGMCVLDEDWSLCDDGIPLRIIKKINLFEVSAVRHPAYQTSNVEARGIEQITHVEVPFEVREKSKEKIMAKDDEKLKDNKPVEEEKTTDKPKKDEEKEEVKDDDKKEPSETPKAKEEVKDNKENEEKRDEEDSQVSPITSLEALSAQLDTVINNLNILVGLLGNSVPSQQDENEEVIVEEEPTDDVEDDSQASDDEEPDEETRSLVEFFEKETPENK